MKKILILFGLSVIFAGCGNSIEQKIANTPEGKLAQCLTEKGAVMYGTQWCGHCSDQKKAFGSESKEFLPFVDCDKKTGTCTKEGITGYPTWKFSDGTTLTGTQSLEDLAQKTGCSYPL